MNAPPQRMNRDGTQKLRQGWVFCFFCSLFIILPVVRVPGPVQGGRPAGDPEKEELKVTNDLLRKENTELRRRDAVHQRELAAATNRLAMADWNKKEGRRGLVADDEDARIAAEWRGLLLDALKVLDDADQGIGILQKRLQQLVFASKEMLHSTEKVSPSKRSLLEGEIRQSEKVLEGAGMDRQRAFLPSPEISALTDVKIIGVRLDLGVAALAAGRRNGVRVGMPFLVMRGKTVLAVLTLGEVREKSSLALIEKMDPDQPIREGDTASLRRR